LGQVTPLRSVEITANPSRSAASDDPAHAAPRVSVVASIGYCAFLGGPPAIGFLGDHITVLRALIVVAVLLGMATLIAGVVRPISGDDQ